MQFQNFPLLDPINNSFHEFQLLFHFFQLKLVELFSHQNYILFIHIKVLWPSSFHFFFWTRSKGNMRIWIFLIYWVSELSKQGPFKFLSFGFPVLQFLNYGKKSRKRRKFHRIGPATQEKPLGSTHFGEAAQFAPNFQE